MTFNFNTGPKTKNTETLNTLAEMKLRQHESTKIHSGSDLAKTIFSNADSHTKGAKTFKRQ